MNTDTLNEMLLWMDKLQGLSAAALISLTCIVVSHILKAIKKFPNEAIPVVVPLWGALTMLLIADPRPTNMPARVWTMRNFSIGLVIGLVSWLFDVIVLTRIEAFLARKWLPKLYDTQFFKKPPNGKDPPNNDK